LPPTARFCSGCGAAVIAVTYVPSRKLVRPIAGRKIAGVCIGLAQTYGWDLALVRIFAVVGLFCSVGLVAVAYLACWIAIPEQPLLPPGEYPPGI
jgi:phage shock protein C